jgi:hypothetical protein
MQLVGEYDKNAGHGPMIEVILEAVVIPSVGVDDGACEGCGTLYR